MWLNISSNKNKNNNTKNKINKTKLLNQKKKKIQKIISVADVLIESFLWHQRPPP